MISCNPKYDFEINPNFIGKFLAATILIKFRHQILNIFELPEIGYICIPKKL
jgi:hypothetical protein